MIGGEGGIRTHGTDNRTLDFESSPFDWLILPSIMPNSGDSQLLIRNIKASINPLHLRSIRTDLKPRPIQRGRIVPAPLQKKTVQLFLIKCVFVITFDNTLSNMQSKLQCAQFYYCILLLSDLLSHSGDRFFAILRKNFARLSVKSMSQKFILYLCHLFLHVQRSVSWVRVAHIIDSQNSISTQSGIYKAILQSESIGLSGIPNYGFFGDLRH